MNGLKIPKWSLWLYISLSLIGFIDAAYVTVKFYLRSPLNCLIFENCSAVINSSYAQIFSIPLSLYGAVFYLTILLLSVYYLDVSARRNIYLLESESRTFVPRTQSRGSRRPEPFGPELRVEGLVERVDVKKGRVIKAIFFLTAFGFIFSLYLLYVQAFLLNQFCLYCLISATISILLFLNSLYNFKFLFKQDSSQSLS